MRVRAIKTGYAGMLRQAGEVFDVPDGTELPADGWLVKASSREQMEPTPVGDAAPDSLGGGYRHPQASDLPPVNPETVATETVEDLPEPETETDEQPEGEENPEDLA